MTLPKTTCHVLSIDASFLDFLGRVNEVTNRAKMGQVYPSNRLRTVVMERDKELVELEDSSRHCSEPSTGRRKDPAELGSSHFKLMSCGIPRWSSCNLFFPWCGARGPCHFAKLESPWNFLADANPTQPQPTPPATTTTTARRERKNILRSSLTRPPISQSAGRPVGQKA